MKKVRVGISFDRDVVEAVDKQVAASPDLSIDRSEIVNAVTRSFFEKEDGHDVRDLKSTTRELLIRERKQKRRQGATRRPQR